MNIFATHKDPFEAANWLWNLDPVRGRKMIVESAQLLSYWCWKEHSEFAEYFYDKGLINKYHKGYVNNCKFTDWLIQSHLNRAWLYRYGLELIRHHNKPHKSERVFETLKASCNCGLLQPNNLTPFVHYAQAKSKPQFSVTPEQCPDVYKAYRIYLKRQVLDDPGYWEK